MVSTQFFSFSFYRTLKPLWLWLAHLSFSYSNCFFFSVICVFENSINLFILVEFGISSRQLCKLFKSKIKPNSILYLISRRWFQINLQPGNVNFLLLSKLDYVCHLSTLSARNRLAMYKILLIYICSFAYLWEIETFGDTRNTLKLKLWLDGILNNPVPSYCSKNILSATNTVTKHVFCHSRNSISRYDLILFILLCTH